MKSISCIIAFSLCVSFTFAQTYKKRTAEDKAHFYTNEMVKELSLDSNTSLKVYEINLAVSLQFDSLYANHPDKDDARKGAISIYKNRDMELRKVLSKTQFLMFDDLQREKREKKRKEREEKETDTSPQKKE